MVAKLWYLKKIDLLDDLADEVIETLSEMTDMEEVSAGETIYLPGQRSDRIYILKKGRVKISRLTREGRKITLALLESGELFGELSLSGEKERSTTAETVNASLVCSLTRERFEEFLSNHPEMALRVTKLFGDRRRDIESRVENLIFRDASGRLSFVLKDLFEDHGVNGGGLEQGSMIEFSHQEIANLAGLTRPTTTNFLNELQDKGVIKLGRCSVTLSNPSALVCHSSE